jgi:hypothetical protein
MTTRTNFDEQLRTMAQSALREMSVAPPVKRRVLGQRRRSFAPLAVALAVAAAAAIAVPIIASRSLHGGPARQAPPAEDGKPASSVLRDMTDAMTHLRSYHAVIWGSTTGGAAVTAELRMDAKGGLAETITSGAQTDRLVVSGGTLYLQGPTVVPQEWQAAAAGRWVSMPAADYASMAQAFLSPGHVIDCLTGTPGQLTTAGVHTVNGTRAVRIVSTRSDATTTGFTLDVADTGRPYALQLQSSDGPSSRPGCAAPSTGDASIPAFPGNETITFDEFNTAALVSVPADVVDTAALPPLSH